MTQIFNKPRSGAADKPEAYLAAFGKHPGWNDHIDDLGLETEGLVSFKRVLYLEGISGAIESGAWDKLDADRRVEGFGHVIVSRGKGVWRAARLWSSSDGKGRTKYPMVVCAEVRGVGLEWVIGKVLPLLERVQAKCVDALSASVVTAVMDTARAELRSGLPSQMEAVSAGGAVRSLAELADHPAIGGPAGGREGLYRLMYQVQRDWGAFTASATTGSGAKSKMLDVRAQHARVPACGEQIGESVRRWIGYLEATVAGGTTTNVIVPVKVGAYGWADLIAGDPAGSQYFCLRASTKAMPMVTEVPYSLDEVFVRQCDERIEQSRRGEGVVTTVVTGAGGRGGGLLSKLFGSKRYMIALIAGVGLIGAGTAIVLSLSGGGGKGGQASTDGQRGGKQGSVAPDENGGSSAKGDGTKQNAAATNGGNGASGSTTEALSDDASVAAWQRLCDEYSEWGFQFVQRLEDRPRGTSYATRREYYQSDEHLSRAMKPMLDAMREGIALDPRSIASVARDERFGVLRKEPPASALTASAKERTTVALRVLESVKNGLSASEWGARVDLEELESGLRSVGRTNEAELTRELLRGVTIGETKDLAAGVDRVLGVQAVAGSLRRRLELIQSGVKVLAGSDDPEVSRVPGWVKAQFAAMAIPEVDEGSGTSVASVLQSVEAETAKIADVVGAIGVFVSANGSNIDREVLGPKREASLGGKPGSSELTRASLVSWLDDAKGSLKLSAESDPRRTWQAETMLAGASATRQKIEKELKAKADEVMTATEGRLAERVRALKELAWNANTKGVLERELPEVEGELRSLLQKYENAYASEKLRLQGSAQEVRTQLSSQQTIVSRSEAVNSAWRKERDRLLAAYTDAQYPALALEAGHLRERLAAFDEALPAGLKVGSAGKRWATMLVDEASRRREELITQRLDAWAMGGAMGSDADGSKLAAARDAAAGEYSGWLREVETLAKEVEHVESLLDQAFGTKERVAEGKGIGETVSGWSGLGIVQSAGISGAIGSVLDRVKALEQVEATADRLALLSTITASTTGVPERVLAAWRQLDQLAAPGWPSSLKQLEEEQALRERVMDATRGIRSPARAAAIESEVEHTRRRRWVRCFEAVTNAGEIEGTAQLANLFGVDEKALPDRLRYNLELVRLKQSVTRNELDDAGVVTAAGGIIERMKGIEGVQNDAGVKTLLAGMGELASNMPAPTPKVDVTRLGPGAAGWSGRMDGDVLEFSRGGGATLRFVRVEPEAGPVVYIGETEVSLGQVMNLVDGAGVWAEFRAFWGEEEDGNPRFGPSVWRWDGEGARGGRMVVSEKWQQEVFRMRPAPADSPAELGVTPPTLESPMNYIGVDAAVFVAGLAGSRVPTVGEWTAAVGSSRGAMEASANLRDQTWNQQQEYLKKTRASTGRTVLPEVQWADTGSFRGVESAREGRATARASRDAQVWFWAVGNGRGEGASGRALNLIGNVAEYVINVPAGWASGERVSAEAVRRYVREREQETFVIGGSALSPPEMDVSKPVGLIEPDEPTSGYSDVGFRLAFTADGAAPKAEPLFGRFARVVAEAGYVLGR